MWAFFLFEANCTFFASILYNFKTFINEKSIINFRAYLHHFLQG